MRSARGNGASQYYRRTVRCKIEFLQGGVWVSGNWQTYSLPDSTEAQITASISQTFPSIGAWQFRIVGEAFDTNGTLFGSVAYDYAEGTLTSASNLALTVTNWGQTATGTMPLAGYTVPSGYTVYEVNYEVAYAVGEARWAHVFEIAGGQFGYTVEYPGTATHIIAPRSGTARWSTTSLTGSIAGKLQTFARPGLATTTPYQTAVLSSGKAVVKSRRPVANSTTASNTFSLQSYIYELSTAQVLASGSVNWIAIGD